MRYSFSQAYPEHVDLIKMKDVYSVGELGCVRDLVALSRPGNDQAIAQVFGSPGSVYGIVGSYRQWPGSAQLWGLFDDRVDRYPIALYKTCALLLNYAVQKQGLRRVSLTVNASYTKGNRFAQALGFDLEGRMVGYLPDGSDANLYARLF